MNEPSRSEGRMNGRKGLVTLPAKSLAREGETKNISKNAAIRNRHPNNQQANTQTCQSGIKTNATKTQKTRCQDLASGFQ